MFRLSRCAGRTPLISLVSLLLSRSACLLPLVSLPLSHSTCLAPLVSLRCFAPLISLILSRSACCERMASGSASNLRSTRRNVRAICWQRFEERLRASADDLAAERVRAKVRSVPLLLVCAAYRPIRGAGLGIWGAGAVYHEHARDWGQWCAPNTALALARLNDGQPCVVCPKHGLSCPNHGPSCPNHGAGAPSLRSTATQGCPAGLGS